MNLTISKCKILTKIKLIPRYFADYTACVESSSQAWAKIQQRDEFVRFALHRHI